MANSKQKSKNNALNNSAQNKIDEIRLKARSNAVRDNRSINFTEELSARANDISKAISNTAKWAKKNKIGTQTKKLLDELTDMAAFFIKNVANGGKE